MTPGGFVSNILTIFGGGIQTDRWHLIAALDFINYIGSSLTELVDKSYKVAPCYDLQPCVQSPYVLISGNIKVNKIDEKYHVTCESCNLNNCITR